MNIAVAQRSQHLKEKSYKAVVHPKLAYCSTISDSRQQKHITNWKQYNAELLDL